VLNPHLHRVALLVWTLLGQDGHGKPSVLKARFNGMMRAWSPLHPPPAMSMAWAPSSSHRRRAFIPWASP